MKHILTILDKTMEGMTFLAGLLLVFIMLAVCFDVILRTFFNIPQMWVTEVTECLLLYITFLASAWLLREGGHVKVDILLNRLKPRSLALLGIISALIGLVVSLVLLIFGASVTWDYYQRGIYTPSAMEFPVFIILFIIPLGSLLLFFEFLRKGVRNSVEFLIEMTKSKAGS